MYGVLDVHRSHRIEIPKVPPQRSADAGYGAGRPDACTLCHVEGLAGREKGPHPSLSLFTSDPVGRAVAADALGRAPSFGGDERARRLGALLGSMTSDDFPAVRHIAWRSLRRLIAPGAAPGEGLGADFDPSGDYRARSAAVERVRRALGSGVRDVDIRTLYTLDAIASTSATGDRRVNDEIRRCRRFGWTSLAAWALFGLAIEAAHGFKLGAYLDDNLRHTILRLAHAHGVILALVVLAFPARAARRTTAEQSVRAARRTGILLRAGALLIPAGFALGAIAPHEGDPGWPVVLVPIGGALLVAGLIRTAWRAWRFR